MRIWFSTLLLLIAATGFAQTTQKKLVQFSGVILNLDSNTVVPYVTITKGAAGKESFEANYKGYFSLVANEGDTLIFSAVGYRREALVIPSNIPDNSYTVMVKMKQEQISLPIVRVFPWASIDEFNKEFMTMEFADDDLQIAKRNVNRGDLLAMAKTLPRDGKEIQSLNFQNNHIELTNKNMNQRMANPLLNPFAWGSLIQQIMQGDKSRNND